MCRLLTPGGLVTSSQVDSTRINEEAFLARPGRARTRATSVRPVELVDHADTRHAAVPPGQGFAYSDTGYVITGILVKQVTGRPLHAVHHELVFGPLGCSSARPRCARAAAAAWCVEERRAQTSASWAAASVG